MLLEVAPDEEARTKAKREVFETLSQLAAQLEESVLPYSVIGPPQIDIQAVLLPEEGWKATVGCRLLAYARELRKANQHLLALGLVEIADTLGGGDESDLILLRAELLEQVGQVDEAMAEVDRLAQRPRDRQQALKLKCLMLLDAGSTHDAVSLAQQMLDEQDDYISLATLSFAVARAGQPARARELIDRAVSRRPRDPNLLHIKLQTATAADSDDVGEVALQVLEVAPDSVEAHGVLAARYTKLGQSDAAMFHARRLAELAPNSVDSHLLLADALDLSGDYEAELEQLAAAGELEPANASIQFHRVRPLLKMPDSAFPASKDRERRVTSTLSAVIENPGAPDGLRATALAMRALYLLVQGARTIANLDFKQALVIGLPPGVEATFTEHLQTIAKVIGEAHTASSG